MSDRIVITRFQGTSMLPTLRSGDRVLWQRVDAIPPPVNTVVGYFAERRLVAHRLIRLDADRREIRTRGDGNLRGDPPLPLGELCFAALGAWRGGRYVDLRPPRPMVRVAVVAAAQAARAWSHIRRGWAGQLARRHRRC